MSDNVETHIVWVEWVWWDKISISGTINNVVAHWQLLEYGESIISYSCWNKFIFAHIIPELKDTEILSQNS